MYPKSDSNRHDLRHKFLRLECLPFHHRGNYHIRQAFYSQLRGIVSNLAHLTAVWVPEDMICSPTWTRTTNISLEVRSYIPLTIGPCTRGGNRTRTNVSVHKILSLAWLPVTPPRYVSKNNTKIVKC